MEQVQIIAEKKMISKLRKEFAIRTFTYSFLYFATIVVFFIVEPIIANMLWTIFLILGLNVLFLMLMSKLATTDAFSGINTTSAPKQSLDRIAGVAAFPMFLFMSVCSFIDVIFFHSIFDLSAGYTVSLLVSFGSIVLVNIIIWSLVVYVYEKRILRKFLTMEE